MIYTLTLNPSVDVFSNFADFQQGQINYPLFQYAKVGGKGINVSYFLNQLNRESIPITVIGGFTGAYLKHTLQHDFHPILFEQKQMTRICYKLIHAGVETAINPKAFPIELQLLEKMKAFLDQLQESDVLVVSGSGCLTDYEYLLSDVKATLVLDVSGDLLSRLVKLKPLMVKPNTEELYQVDPNDDIAYQKLLKYCKIILHTKGDKGAQVVTQNETYYLPIIGNDIVSSVGCGDAYLAGFLKVYLDGHSIEDAFRFGADFAYQHGKKPLFNI